MTEVGLDRPTEVKESITI